MSSRNETIRKTLLVSTLLCIVCSVFVSSSAVGLKKIQDRNKALDRNKNILIAAGLFQEGEDTAKIPEIFQKRVETRLFEFETGEFTDEVDAASFDQRKAARDPALSEPVPGEKDIATIKRRSKYAPVYLVQEAGELSQVVLPIHGMGLWSTMYGFLAVDKDASTVRGVTFYDHGETPGLGGEVENPRWQALWVGKEIFDDQGNLDIEVIKGTVDTSRKEAKHQVDGLAGATITSRGVTHLVHYWLGKDGFGPLLKKLKKLKTAS